MHLTLVAGGQKLIRHFQLNDNLLDIIRDSDVPLHAPCGGKGTCKKCEVDIAGPGTVLACRTLLDADLLARADQPLTVTVQPETTAQISTDGVLPGITLDPLVYKGSCRLPAPSLNDQRPDDERFESVTGLKIPFRLLSQLPDRLRASDFAPTFYFRTGINGEAGEVLRFTDPDSAGPLGVAVDIGTTTLAGYLYDLDSGKRLAAASALNPQSAYGADVISRIDQSSASPAMRDALKKSITGAIKSLAGKLAAKGSAAAGRQIVLDDIIHYVMAGNTTMMHLLAGLPAMAIARAPFIPASRRTLTLSAAELGLPVAPDASCQLMPSIASYVGADITAGILASGLLDDGQSGRILLDIGTNGEIVAAGPNGAVACSTAAGPAFEGANIRCGLGGVQGAIDEVVWTGEDLEYTVIGDNGTPVKPRGICGSGLVAAVASLLDSGLLEDTGRITDEPENLPPHLSSRLTEIDGQAAVILAQASETEDGEPIVLTQKDIRELQNAKAAIAAGIELLIDRAGLQTEQISQIFIAGGFGNYLEVVHAFRIGLLPPSLRGRTYAAGNTSGMGAIVCLLEHEKMRRAAQIANEVEYFELSGDRRFVDLYVEAMMFPEREE